MITLKLTKCQKTYYEATMNKQAKILFFLEDKDNYILNKLTSYKLDAKTFEIRFVEKNRLVEYIQKRDEQYKRQIEHQKKIDEDSADDDWRKEFLSSVSDSIKNKGAG